MKKKLLFAFMVTGVLGATSACASTYTSNMFYTYINYAKDYYGGDTPFTLINGSTGAATTATANQVLAIPSSNVNSFVAGLNGVLQEPQCSATFGSAGNINFSNMSYYGYCADKIQTLYAQHMNLQPTGGTPVHPNSGSNTVKETISKAVTPQIQRATSIQQATIISNVLSNVFSGRAPNAPGAPMRVSLNGEKGMAAGNAPAKLNVWVNASDTTVGNSASTSMFDGTVTNALGGLDYRVNDRFVAGVSVGYDRVDLDFKFLANSGMLSEGFLVAPYASYQVSDIISVDGAYGYAKGDVDTRASGATSSQSYDRNFLALNLNANYWMNDWQLTGKANYIFAEEKMDTTNKMEQLRLGGQIGYWREGIMPYAGIAYVRDLKVSSSAPGGMPASADKDAWVGSVGVNFFSKGAFSAGISYTEEFDRDDSKNYTFMANVGYRF